MCENAHIWSSDFKNFPIAAQSRGLRCHSILSLLAPLLFLVDSQNQTKYTKNHKEQLRTLICIEEQASSRNRLRLRNLLIHASGLHEPIHSAQPGPILVGPRIKPRAGPPARADLCVSQNHAGTFNKAVQIIWHFTSSSAFAKIWHKNFPYYM